jgi:hypothetical protein
MGVGSKVSEKKGEESQVRIIHYKGGKEWLDKTRIDRGEKCNKSERCDANEASHLILARIIP